MAVPSSSSLLVASQEVTKARRRRFTAEYRAWVVQETDRCREAGEIGAFLRKEGLFSSQLTEWRKKYRNGGKTALSVKRGPRKKNSGEKSEVDRLRRENEKLKRKLEQAHKIIGLQKKVASLLGRPIPDESGEDE